MLRPGECRTALLAATGAVPRLGRPARSLSATLPRELTPCQAVVEQQLAGFREAGTFKVERVITTAQGPSVGAAACPQGCTPECQRACGPRSRRRLHVRFPAAVSPTSRLAAPCKRMPSPDVAWLHELHALAGCFTASRCRGHCKACSQLLVSGAALRSFWHSKRAHLDRGPHCCPLGLPLLSAMRRNAAAQWPHRANTSGIASANNYLGLSNHPDVAAAAIDAIKTHGFGLSSVRFICGTQVGGAERP